MTDPKQTVPFEQNDNKSTDTKQLSDTWPDDALADLAARRFGETWQEASIWNTV